MRSIGRISTARKNAPSHQNAPNRNQIHEREHSPILIKASKKNGLPDDRVGYKAKLDERNHDCQRDRYSNSMQNGEARNNNWRCTKANAAKHHLELPHPLIGSHFKLERSKHNASDQPQRNQNMGDDCKPTGIADSCWLYTPSEQAFKRRWTPTDNWLAGNTIAKICGKQCRRIIAIARIPFETFGTNRINRFGKFWTNMNQTAR